MSIGYLDSFQLIMLWVTKISSNWLIQWVICRYSVRIVISMQKNCHPTDRLEISCYGCMQVGKIEHLIMDFKNWYSIVKSAGYLFICSPLLNWRDLQHIVVQTSRQANLKADDWTTNGAGKKGRYHSELHFIAFALTSSAWSSGQMQCPRRQMKNQVVLNQDF